MLVLKMNARLVSICTFHSNFNLIIVKDVAEYYGSFSSTGNWLILLQHAFFST